jgi:hypothetical protein
MEPLLVTAWLVNGYAASDPWSPALEGILAYWALREQLGEEEFALGMTGHRPVVEAELPLARESWEGHWWWCVSSPLAEARATFESWTHRRFDDGPALGFTPETVRRVLTAGGPYKAYRTRHTRIVTPWVRWHAIGDAAELRRLLARCHNIGAGYAHGWGQVRAWTVEPGGDAAIARFRRPLPVEFAAAHMGQLGPGTQMDWGIRPPGRRPEQRTRCFMPELR